MPLENELIGFVTDGTKGCFVSRNDTGVTTEPFSKLSFDNFDRLVQAIIKLCLIALSSENLKVSQAPWKLVRRRITPNSSR